MWQVWTGGLAVLLVLMTGTWFVSVVRRDASLVDRVWGLAFVLATVTYTALGNGSGARTLLTLVLVSIWGLRLSAYITWRNWGEGEDRRYAAMREADDAFTVTSLFKVFWLQAAIAWVVSLPLASAAARTTPEGLTWVDGLGVAIWLVGFVFEAGGDRQLSRFLADPANRGKVMDRGFWRYTRHPNYFGDSMVWWGFYLLALATGAWWTAIGPAVMTFTILRVSGVALTDRNMSSSGSSRAGYDEYVRRTNAFVPGPRKT